MKTTILICTILVTLGMLSCKDNGTQKNTKQYDESNTVDVSQYENTVFVPTIESKIDKPDANVLYATTLLYAWDELRNESGGKITVNPSDTELTNINNSISYKNTLSPNEYSNTIEKTEDILTIKSSFKIKLPFKDEMQETEVAFNGKSVKAFGMDEYDYRITDEISILYYKDDNCFIVELRPSASDHIIYLAKGFNNRNTLSDILTDIQKHINVGKQDMTNEKTIWKYHLGDVDQIRIPNLFLNVSNSYDGIINKAIVAGGNQFMLTNVTQLITMEINKAGAKVESEAEIALAAAVSEETAKPKYLFFNKPYVIYMKKDKSEYPYFMMKVQNTTFMKEI